MTPGETDVIGAALHHAQRAANLAIREFLRFMGEHTDEDDPLARTPEFEWAMSAWGLVGGVLERSYAAENEYFRRQGIAENDLPHLWEPGGPPVDVDWRIDMDDEMADYLIERSELDRLIRLTDDEPDDDA